MTQDPFKIELRMTEKMHLQAFLLNRSSSPQTYLKDLLRQPIQLHIVDEGGKAIRFFDTRSRKKFDSTIRRSRYKILPDGGDVLFEEGPFEKEAGRGYSLLWGPYSFEGMAPGRYSVSVTWKSAKTAYQDARTGKKGTMEETWLGTVQSSPLEVTLP